MYPSEWFDPPPRLTNEQLDMMAPRAADKRVAMSVWEQIMSKAFQDNRSFKDAALALGYHPTKHEPLPGGPVPYERIRDADPPRIPDQGWVACMADGTEFEVPL
jgi:hypothetical protein